MEGLSLLPAPRELHLVGGVCRLAADRLILLDSAAPHTLLFTAERIEGALSELAGVRWEAVASRAVPPAQVGLTLRVGGDTQIQPQGYRLDIAPAGITISAADDAGAFYGVATLIQVIRSSARSGRPVTALPCLRIADWPDYPARGVMLDVSRDKVPTMDTLYALVDRLAGWKINQVQLYTEHTFAYRNHPEVWANASPFTGQEILALDAFCRRRYIELVPNQNSFGHMHRWLNLPRYIGLAELTGKFSTPWGHEMEGPFSLCPLDPGSSALIESLYDELLPHFTSRLFNVGCDETIDVGQGRSQEACARLGPGRVYLDFLLKVYRAVSARGRTMQFWGDIIIQHPELIAELPKDMVALEWGYEANHPFDAHGQQFAAAGIPFYVCPGTSTWCSIAGRTDNALGNLLNAAENGLKHGAVGYLHTDWGDAGHWQALPASYLGFAAGAAYSWALAANRSLDIRSAVSLYAFEDETGAMGRVAYDLGNVYKASGFVPNNGSALFWALQWPLRQVQSEAAMLDPTVIDCTLEAIDGAMAPLPSAAMRRPDAALITREYEIMARMLRHAARRIALVSRPGSGERPQALERDLAGIIAEYSGIWLARNRPGGLVDSVARLEQARADYC